MGLIQVPKQVHTSRWMDVRAGWDWDWNGVTKANAATSYDLGVRMGRGCHTIGSPSAPAIKDNNLTDLSGC